MVLTREGGPKRSKRARKASYKRRIVRRAISTLRPEPLCLLSLPPRCFGFLSEQRMVFYLHQIGEQKLWFRLALTCL
jgi:hypothetical protein